MARQLQTTPADVLGGVVLGGGSADTLWLMICAFLVFFMQCGFALLEAGTVRAKNTKNILLKNLLDACVGAMIWWSFGHSIAVRSAPRPRHSAGTRCTNHQRAQAKVWHLATLLGDAPSIRLPPRVARRLPNHGARTSTSWSGSARLTHSRPSPMLPATSRRVAVRYG